MDDDYVSTAHRGTDAVSEYYGSSQSSEISYTNNRRLVPAVSKVMIPISSCRKVCVGEVLTAA